MNKFFVAFVLLLGLMIQAQVSSNEKMPVFEACATLLQNEQERCFFTEVKKHVHTSFVMPEQFQNSDFKAEIITVFAVDEKGRLLTLFVDAPYAELKDEMERVFELFPLIQPATFNGKPTYSKYTLKFVVPFGAKLLGEESGVFSSPAPPESKLIIDKDGFENEFENMGYVKYESPKYESTYNIPFSHSLYAQFDDEINHIGNNNHTASKPLTYKETKKYYDHKEAYKKLLVDSKSWWGRKLLNEDLVAYQTERYWFNLNFIWDLRLGKDRQSSVPYTFHNTRGIQAQAGLGKRLTFYTTIFESQGRFADYFNNYTEQIGTDRGSPIVPGIGIAKPFKTDSFDFPSADANITYAASDMIDIQLGYGRNFIGDGYRSMLISDAVSTYPYAKINTTFWKLKYTNTYMVLKDVRRDVTFEKTYATKYIVNHYLSYNVSKRWNVGFFESVVWSNNNQRGFDANFINPVIFFRTVEFNSSGRSGNALMGLTSKYKISNKVNVYGQFLLDEFSMSTLKAQQNDWKSKYGTQLGVKYYKAFGVENLLLQAEYNMARPYTYSHSLHITNYGHNNQSMAHIWETNFKEAVFIARYFKGRWSADAKLNIGVRGFDYNTASDTNNYGGDIYKSYEEDIPYFTGIKVGNGNSATVLIGDLSVAYLVNPTSNLKLFGNLMIRNFSPETNTAEVFESKTTWISFGLRSDIFNFYTDF